MGRRAAKGTAPRAVGALASRAAPTGAAAPAEGPTSTQRGRRSHRAKLRKMMIRRRKMMTITLKGLLQRRLGRRNGSCSRAQGELSSGSRLHMRCRRLRLPSPYSDRPLPSEALPPTAPLKTMNPKRAVSSWPIAQRTSAMGTAAPQQPWSRCECRAVQEPVRPRFSRPDCFVATTRGRRSSWSC